MDRVAFSQRAPLRLVRCSDCGLVYRNPVERADGARRDLRRRRARRRTSCARCTTRSARRTRRRRARLTEIFGRRGSGHRGRAAMSAPFSPRRATRAGSSPASTSTPARTSSPARSASRWTTAPSSRSTTTAASTPSRSGTVSTSSPIRAATLRAARAHLAPGGMLALRVPNGACYAALRPLLAAPRRHRTRVARAEQPARLSLSLRLHPDVAIARLSSGIGFARGARRRRRARPDRRPVDAALGRAGGALR